MVTSFKWSCALTVTHTAPDPAAGHTQAMPLPETPGHSQASLALSVLGITAPFSWVLVPRNSPLPQLDTINSSVLSLLYGLTLTSVHDHWCAQGFVCALQVSVSPVLCKFCSQIPLASKVKFPGDSQSLCQISRLRNLLWILELS